MRTPAMVLIFTLSLVVGAMGCGGGEGNGDGGQASERDGLRWINEDAIDGGYFHVDVARQDKDLAEMLDSFFSEEMSKEDLGDLGVDISRIDYVVFQTGEFGESAGVAEGQIDVEGVRDRLRELDLRPGTYEDTEFWEGPYGIYDNMGVAFLPDKLIWGEEESVKSIIRAIKGIDRSFYESDDIREILSILPQWIPLSLIVTYDAEYAFGLPGADIAVMAVAQKDGDLLKLAMVVGFTDLDAAQRICQSQTDDDDIRVRCQGRFVIFEGETTVEDFVN